LQLQQHPGVVEVEPHHLQFKNKGEYRPGVTAKLGSDCHSKTWIGLSPLLSTKRKKEETVSGVLNFKLAYWRIQA